MSASDSTIDKVEAVAEEIGESVSPRKAEALGLIRYYSAWSFGAGVVPVPGLDMVAVMGVQTQMLRRMSDLYEVKFWNNKVKNFVGILMGGIVPEAIATGGVGYLLRGIPAIGPIIGLFTMSAFSTASTYAIGRVFMEHFESGGTLLDFNPQKAKAFVRSEYEKAKGNPSGKRKL